MRIVRGISLLPHPISQAVVTIGNFDGVHLGHQKLVKTAQALAEKIQGRTVVYTFTPHPKTVLNPTQAPALLCTHVERIEMFRQWGVDDLIEEPFDLEFSKIEPETFFAHCLIEKLGAAAIVVGYDFAFGKNRNGNLESLRNFCNKSSVELHVVEPQKMEGETISSSHIRKHLLLGEIEKANLLLGRSFSYSGKIFSGDSRGRKLGFPTANFLIGSKIRLPYGVYATRSVFNHQMYPSVTNVGIRPTFSGPNQNDPEPIVETYFLLPPPESLLEKFIEVQFVSHLREERKFSSPELLRAQIETDILRAKKILSIKE